MCSFIVLLPQSICATGTVRDALLTISEGAAVGSPTTEVSSLTALHLNERTVEVPSNHTRLSFPSERFRGAVVKALIAKIPAAAPVVMIALTIAFIV
jgi:hypothetical protein